MAIMDNPGLTEETFRQLRDLIYDKTGIMFAENKIYLLENRLKIRLEECGFSNYEEYFYFIKYDPRRKDELQHLYNSVTTNETSFFRDNIQTNAFYNDVLPLIVEENKKNNNRAIRVWSAASSSGEEAYTLAMQMSHKGLVQQGWRLEVTGSDISDKVLASAREGIYGQNAVRNAPRDYLSRYFTNSGDVYELSQDIKKMVTFRNLNLVDEAAMRGMRNYDVIFCRNVLIYFDTEAKKKVIAALYDSLRPGGYLFIGYSESLHNISRSFKLKHFNKALVYQKEI